MKISYDQFFSLIIYAIIMGGSQLILVKAAKEIGDKVASVGFLSGIFSSYWLYIGIIFYTFAMMLWLYLIFKIDIRIAYPIASTAVIFAALFQSYLDGYFPSYSYWIGLVCVIIGLTLIQVSK